VAPFLHHCKSFVFFPVTFLNRIVSVPVPYRYLPSCGAKAGGAATFFFIEQEPKFLLWLSTGTGSVTVLWIRYAAYRYRYWYRNTVVDSDPQGRNLLSKPDREPLTILRYRYLIREVSYSIPVTLSFAHKKILKLYHSYRIIGHTGTGI
jgi:hypothetical protein